MVMFRSRQIANMIGFVRNHNPIVNHLTSPQINQTLSHLSFFQNNLPKQFHLKTRIIWHSIHSQNDIKLPPVDFFYTRHLPIKTALMEARLMATLWYAESHQEYLTSTRNHPNLEDS